MRSSFFYRGGCWTLGLVIFSSLFFNDAAWSQGQRTRSRNDNNFFTLLREDKTFASNLKLSKDQEGQVSKLREELMGLFRKRLGRDEWVQAAKEIEEKAIALLDDSQKAVWEKRKQEATAQDDSRRDGSRRDSGSSERSSTSDSGAPAASSNTRATILDEKPPEGEIAVVSFGAKAAAKLAKEKEEDDSNNPAANLPSKNVADLKMPGAKEEANLRFTFRYAPWADVLKLFADVNDLTLDLNDVPPGTFNYYDDKTYTMTQALDILNGYLMSKGYALIRRDRFLVCLNIADNPIPWNSIPSITEDELPERGNNELLSLIMPLQGGLEAEKMATEVAPLMGPLGKASALKSSNSLVLTDIGSNLRRIYKLLKTTQPAYTGDNAFRAISLKHITALEAERTVRKHFNLNPAIGTTTTGGGFGRGGGGWPGGGGGGWPGGGGGGNPWGGGGWGGDGGRGGRGGNNGFDGGQGGGFPGQGGAPAPAAPTAGNQASPFAGKIQVTADTRLNILIVTASTQLIKIVEDIVKAMDTEPDRAANQVDEKPTFFQSYTVLGNDVTSMAQMLNNVVPGVVVGYDVRSGKIFAQGTADEHSTIQRTLKSSGDASGSVAVIQLVKLDPGQVTNSLRNLFQAEGTRGPSVEADATGRRILVRGTGDQLSQIKALLRDMGEVSAGGPMLDPNGNPVEEDRGNVRTLNVGGLDPNDVLDLVQRTWGAQGRSPIRVVIPSQPSPIRDRRVPGAGMPRIIPGTTPGTTTLEPSQPERRPTARTKTEARNDVTSRDQDAGSLVPKSSVRETASATPARKRPATTQIIPRQVAVIQASQVEESSSDDSSPAQESQPQNPGDDPDEPSSGDNPSSATNSSDKPNGSPRKRTDKQPSSQKSAETKANLPESDQPPSIIVHGNELVIMGDNKKDLDQIEDMINALVGAISPRTRWTVFYLRTADATECAQMLERLFPQSSVTTTPTGSDGLFGSFTSGLSTFGRGMMNATGLNNQTLGGQNLRIITDVRSNALFVTGSPEVIADVEQMLQLLDSSELPGNARDRLPRSIPVEYADIDEVAEIIESVFKDQMTAEQQQGGQQGFNPLAAMFGGGRGGRGGQPQKPAAPELSLGVDHRTSHLIVQCSETMFQRIESMVKAIDQRAKDANSTVRMIALRTADPMIVQSTLTSLIPKVTVSATRNRPRRGNTQNGATPGAPGSGQTNQAPDATRDQQILQRMMNQNSQQNGFGRPGGGFPGAGGNGGGFNRGGGNGGGGGNRGGGRGRQGN